MPGRKPTFTRPPARPFRSEHPLAKSQAAKKGPSAPVAAPSTDDAGTKPSTTPKDTTPALDGAGKPFITLAQLLKKHAVVGTGGEAKHRVRAGGITVNGDNEDRPGRKLHVGDVVIVDGKPLAVTIG